MNKIDARITSQPTPAVTPDGFQEKATQAAMLLKAMANEKRLQILCRIGMEEVSVGDLAMDLGLSQSALSQHLSVLRHQNLVSIRRDRQTKFYHISNPAVSKVIEALVSIYCPEINK